MGISCHMMVNSILKPPKVVEKKLTFKHEEGNIQAQGSEQRMVSLGEMNERFAQGDPDAQYNLGLLYSDGLLRPSVRGLEQNAGKARELFFTTTVSPRWSTDDVDVALTKSFLPGVPALRIGSKPRAPGWPVQGGELLVQGDRC
jgi:hypothetical protein